MDVYFSQLCIISFALFFASCNSEWCTFCPHEAEWCDENSIYLKKGFWRASQNSTYVYQCLDDDSCGGGNVTGQSSCLPGYEGPICSICEYDYFRATNGGCVDCSQNYFMAVCVAGAILVILGFAFVPMLWILRVLLKRGGYSDTIFQRLSPTKIIVAMYCYIYGIRTTNYSMDDLDVKSAIETVVVKQLASTVSRILPKFKIVLSMFQIVALLPYVLHFRYESTNGTYARHLGRVSRFTNLNQGLSIECFSHSFDYVYLLVLSGGVPLAAAIILLNISRLHQLYITSYFPALRRLPTVLQKLREEYWWVLLQGLLVVCPCVLTTAFGAFSCHEIVLGDSMGTESYLRADYSIVCGSYRHKLGIYIGIVVVVLYGVGVPMLYMYVLSNRPSLAKPTPITMAMSRTLSSGVISRSRSELAVSALKHGKYLNGSYSLYSSYKPQYW